MPTVIAHRGSHEHEPENTLAAFQAAAESGAEMVELDVRRTADGALAVFHDPEVARTALARMSLADLRAAAGVDVPVLSDVLAWAQDTGMGLDVELKEDGYVGEVVALLSACRTPLIITSFLDPVLAQLARLAPGLERGLLLSLTAMGAVNRLRQCDAHGAVIAAKLVDVKVLDALEAAGFSAWVWDFLPTRPGDRRWLEDPRIRGFITDDVPGTRAALA